MNLYYVLNFSKNGLSDDSYQSGRLVFTDKMLCRFFWKNLDLRGYSYVLFEVKFDSTPVSRRVIKKKV